MRAKIASAAGGHAFEERFLNLSKEQLLILYKQAVNEEEEKKKEIVDVVSFIIKTLFGKLDNLSELSQLFANPELYKKKRDMEDIKKHSSEVSVEDFDQVWEDIMAVIPSEIIAEEPTQEEYVESPMDPEMEEKLSGWIRSRIER